MQFGGAGVILVLGVGCIAASGVDLNCPAVISVARGGPDEILALAGTAIAHHGDWFGHDDPAGTVDLEAKAKRPPAEPGHGYLASSQSLPTPMSTSSGGSSW